MFYKSDINYLNISNEDKKKLKDFLVLLNENEHDKLVCFTHEELRNIFKIVKSDPKLQIKIWRNLPQELVYDSENIEIFEDVLENKFGEYIHGIDKKALVKLLNSSRSPIRSNR